MSESFSYDNLIAGSQQPLVSAPATVALGQVLGRGALLGRITKAIAAAVDDEGNTGDGTVSGQALGAGAQVGTYVLTCVTDGLAAADPVDDEGNTGDGTLTLVALTSRSKAGTYRLVCTAAADAGPPEVALQFAVYDPDGSRLADVGAGAFALEQLEGTLTQGDTPFAVGDEITVLVSASASGNTFSVVDPAGTALANATVGVAYDGEIAFTLAAGDTAFVAGDTFSLVVSAGTGYCVQADATAHDGSELPYAVLAEAVDATDAAVLTSVYLRGEFAEDALGYAAGQDAADWRDACAAQGLYLRSTLTV